MFKEIFKKGTKSFLRLQCNGCGKEYVRPIGHVSPDRRNTNVNHFCHPSCMTKKYNGRWNGGKTLHGKGYVVARDRGKAVLEHRLVMEGVLGRPLTKYETVHHIDGNRENNNIDNLQLRLLSNHPPGIETTLTQDITRLLRENTRLKNEIETGCACQ